MALHTVTFPNTYSDAETIINKLGNGNVLKVLKSAETLQGYAYIELDRELREASLEVY